VEEEGRQLGSNRWGGHGRGRRRPGDGRLGGQGCMASKRHELVVFSAKSIMRVPPRRQRGCTPPALEVPPRGAPHQLSVLTGTSILLLQGRLLVDGVHERRQAAHAVHHGGGGAEGTQTGAVRGDQAPCVLTFHYRIESSSFATMPTGAVPCPLAAQTPLASPRPSLRRRCTGKAAVRGL
jgi:hypothetical protein